MTEPFVLHCHMPKSGGRVLNRRVLDARYGTERVHRLYCPGLTSTSRLPLHHRSRAMRCYAAAGHVPFGYVDEIYPATLYVSVFRDPVDRFLSFLNDLRHAPGQTLPDHPGSVTAARIDDPDALVMAALTDPQINPTQSNAQTRLASGMAWMIDTPLDQSHLSVALQNIRSPRYLTSLYDDLDGFAILLDDCLPGEALAATAALGADANETPLTQPLTADVLRPATRDAIRARNTLDLHLLDAQTKSPKRQVA